MPLCRHGSEEVELTAWPAPWLKTIKSKVEIGRSLAVTYNSGTDVRHCKFPLAATPRRQTHGQMEGCVSVRVSVCVYDTQALHTLIHVESTEDISEQKS